MLILPGSGLTNRYSNTPGQSYLEEMIRFDPAAALQELVVIADMNHVLKRVVSDDRNANVAAYANLLLPNVPEVADALAVFVVRTHRSR